MLKNIKAAEITYSTVNPLHKIYIHIKQSMLFIVYI